MSERFKRIAAILSFIILIVVLGFGIWWFFFRPVFRPTPPPPVPPPPPPIGLIPSLPAGQRIPVPPTPPAPQIPSPTAKGGLTETASLTTAPVLAPFLSSDGRTIQYYNRTDGKFYRIRPDGTLEALSDKTFFNVSNITWAPDRGQAILEYPDGSNILYNFTTHRQVTLPRHWRGFSFSPRSDGIAFLSLGEDTSAQWLATAAPDGSSTKPIEPLGTNASKVQVAWSPNDQVIAFSRTGQAQGLNAEEILLVGKQGENFRALEVNGIGFRGNWSPDGGRILYSTTSSESDWKPELWVVDGTPDRIGGSKVRLGLNTWADKCTFGSAATLYCAVPDTLPRGVGLYPAAAEASKDRLWQVNLETGQRELIAVPYGDYNIERLVVSDDERLLYFTDKLSGQLYKINLK